MEPTKPRLPADSSLELLSFRVPRVFGDQLREAAHELDVSVSALVRLILRAWLRDRREAA